MDEQNMSVPAATMTQPPSGPLPIDPKLAANPMIMPVTNHKMDQNLMYNNTSAPPQPNTMDASYQQQQQYYYQQQQQQRYYAPNAGQYQQQPMPMMPMGGTGMPVQGQFNQFNATGPPAQPGQAPMNMNGQMAPHYPNYYYPQQAQMQAPNYYNNYSMQQPNGPVMQMHPSMMPQQMNPHGGMMQPGMMQPTQQPNAYYNTTGMKPNGAPFSQTGASQPQPQAQLVQANNSVANNNVNSTNGPSTASPTSSPAKKGRKPSVSKAEKSKSKKDASTPTNGITSSSSDTDSRLSTASSPHIDGIDSTKPLESIKEEKQTKTSKPRKPRDGSPTKSKKNQTVSNHKTKSGEENSGTPNHHSDSNHSNENSTSKEAINSNENDTASPAGSPTKKTRKTPSTPRQTKRKNSQVSTASNETISTDTNDSNRSNETESAKSTAGEAKAASEPASASAAASETPKDSDEVAKSQPSEPTAALDSNTTTPQVSQAASSSSSNDQNSNPVTTAPTATTTTPSTTATIYQQSQMLPPPSPSNGSSSSSSSSSSSLSCMNNASINLNLAKSTVTPANTNVPSPSSSYSASSPASTSSSMNSSSANSNVSSSHQASSTTSTTTQQAPVNASNKSSSDVADDAAAAPAKEEVTKETSAEAVNASAAAEPAKEPETESAKAPPNESSNSSSVNAEQPAAKKSKTSASTSSIVPSLINSSSLSADNSNMSFINDHEQDEDASMTTSCDDPLSPKLNHASSSSSLHLSSSSSKSHNVDVLGKLVEMGGPSEEPALAEKRKDFAAKLKLVWEDYSIKLRSVPNISKVPLDLFRVYSLVRERGGFNEVTKNKAWRDISNVLSVGSSASAAFNVRKKYISLGILHFECRHDLNGIDPQPIIDEVERTTNPKQKNKMNKSESESQPSTPTKTTANPAAAAQLTGGSGKKKKSSKADKEAAKAAGELESPAKSSTPNPTNLSAPQQAANPSMGGMQSAQMMPPPPAPGHAVMMPGQYDYSAAAAHGQQPMPYQSSQPYGAAAAGMQQGQQQYAPQQNYYGQQRPYGGYGQQYGAIPQNTMYSQQPQQIQRVYNPAAPTGAPADASMMYQQQQQQQQYNQQMRYPMQAQSQINQMPGMIPQQAQASQVQQPHNPQMVNQQQQQQQQQYPQMMPGQQAPAQAYMNPQQPQAHPQPVAPGSTGQQAAGATAQMNGYMQPAAQPPAGMMPHGAQTAAYPGQQAAGGVVQHAPAQRSSSTDDIAQIINSVASHPPKHQQQQTPHRHPHGAAAAGHHHAQKGVPGGQLVPQPSMVPVQQLPVKKELVFPPGSVEAILPAEPKKRKICAKNIGPCDPWRLFMSLKSGLLAESTWALDALNILLYDDNSVAYFHLSHFPGLVNILLEHFLKCLKLIFNEEDGEFADMSLNEYSRAFGESDDFAELYASSEEDEESDSDASQMSAESETEASEEEACENVSVAVPVQKRPRGRPPKAAKIAAAAAAAAAAAQAKVKVEQQVHEEEETSEEKSTRQVIKQINGYHKELCEIQTVTSTTRSRRLTTIVNSHDSKTKGPTTKGRQTETKSTSTAKSEAGQEAKNLIKEKKKRAREQMSQNEQKARDDHLKVLRIGFNHEESRRRFLSQSKEVSFNDSNVCHYWNKYNRKILAAIKKSRKAAQAKAKRANNEEPELEIKKRKSESLNTADDDDLCRKLIFSKNRKELDSYLYSCFSSGDEITELRKMFYGDYYDQRVKLEKEASTVEIETDSKTTANSAEKEKTAQKRTNSVNEEFVNRHRSWSSLNGASEKKSKRGGGNFYYDDQISSTVDEEAVFKLVNQRENDLISRCTSISTILRNLSFVPGNDVELCKYPMLLEILARLLVLKHRHQIVICKSNIDLDAIKSAQARKAARKAAAEKKDASAAEANGGEKTESESHKHMNGEHKENEEHAKTNGEAKDSETEDVSEEEDELDEAELDENELDELYNRCVKKLMNKKLFYRDDNKTLKFDRDGSTRSARSKINGHANGIFSSSSSNENDQHTRHTSGCKDDWWLECVELLRENTLVTVANIASALNLNSLDESVIELYAHGLVHWSICRSQEARDPFPTMHDTNMLTPQRLAIEALSKMSINEVNVDLVLSTISTMRPYLEALVSTLCNDLLVRRDDETLREFAIVLLTALAKGDQFAARIIAKYSTYLISFIEDFEEQAKRFALMNPSAMSMHHHQHQQHMHGGHHGGHGHHGHHGGHHGGATTVGNANSASSETVSNINEESLSTTIDMLRRCANCLKHVAVHRENAALVMKHENRLLDLITSQFVDFEVSQRLSEVLFACSFTGPMPVQTAFL